ncbi:MAG TPA: hypothetical protein VK083_15450 [Nocardia sp.]|nr:MULTISPECIES: hypothetical protein [Nocardia]HLS78177.1 hypothetical protein [Nocardia sp.]
MSRAVHRACVLLIILAAAVTAFRTAGPAGTTGDPDDLVRDYTTPDHTGA